jgi:hypothetical protein
MCQFFCDGFAAVFLKVAPAWIDDNNAERSAGVLLMLLVLLLVTILVTLGAEDGA